MVFDTLYHLAVKNRTPQFDMAATIFTEQGVFVFPDKPNEVFAGKKFNAVICKVPAEFDHMLFHHEKKAGINPATTFFCSPRRSLRTQRKAINRLASGFALRAMPDRSPEKLKKSPWGRVIANITFTCSALSAISAVRLLYVTVFMKSRT